ncbi:MAG: type III-B CRISPR-associated protein Cas10/Cmr2 [Lewinellaceae bacterium]|nr:type III-B CRISPR-associated protein Cas10/Cmr2 [Lewinellaceae bacterium]
MNNHFLILFTIGPVQSFIAQARKTQDLYAGSQILSALTKIAIDKFKQEFPSGEVIYPIFTHDAESLSLPNRFIGKAEGTAEKLKEKAKAIQVGVENEWQDIARRALGKANVSAPTGFEDQIKAHLDIHWVYKEITTDFATAYQELERLGGAVKNVRQFAQYEYNGEKGEAGRKCSIDGKNNALFYRKNGRRKPAYLENATELERFVLNPGEGLSAVSLVKRFYLEGKNKETFPSTAEVALMHDEGRLDDEQKEILQFYKRLFSNRKEEITRVCLDLFNKNLAGPINLNGTENWNPQFDYQMLFEENLNTKNIPNSKQLELLHQLQRKLSPHLKTKYYALVLFDGDKMGKWLAGENNKTKDNLESFHETLSGALSRFGAYARNYLNREKHNGHAVYSGGDDFLGFVNIYSLFEVMKHLREAFDNKVNQAIVDFKQADNHLTFSAGILIAHYKTPYSEVLKKAREIEKKAKKEGGRNAFCITVIKHSGEVQEAIFKWDISENAKLSSSGCANWDALAHIVKELDEDEGHFSTKFIQNLASEFFQLTGTDLYDLDTTSRDTRHLENALAFEMKRLIGRAMDKKENTKTDEECRNDLWKSVKTLWDNAPKPNKVRHFIHALQIADFLTRKTTQD